MKLFIWDSPIGVPYGGTCLYVVAKDEAQARKIAKRAKFNRYGTGPKEWDEELGDVPLGEPRVEKLPYGECYYWSE